MGMVLWTEVIVEHPFKLLLQHELVFPCFGLNFHKSCPITAKEKWREFQFPSQSNAWTQVELMNFDQTSKKLILLQKTFLPALAIIVPIAYTQNHTLNAQADISGG